MSWLQIGFYLTVLGLLLRLSGCNRYNDFIFRRWFNYIVSSSATKYVTASWRDTSLYLWNQSDKAIEIDYGFLFFLEEFRLFWHRLFKQPLPHSQLRESDLSGLRSEDPSLSHQHVLRKSPPCRWWCWADDYWAGILCAHVLRKGIAWRWLWILAALL